MTWNEKGYKTIKCDPNYVKHKGKKEISGKMIGLYAFLCFPKYSLINYFLIKNNFSLNLVLKNMSRTSEHHFNQNGVH